MSKRERHDVLQEDYHDMSADTNTNLRNKFMRETFHLNVIDDSVKRQNMLEMLQKDRLEYINITENPFGYSEEYYHIYEREKTIRGNINDKYCNCYDITDTKFSVISNSQISSEYVSKVYNVNCIRNTSYVIGDNIKYLNPPDHLFRITEFPLPKLSTNSENVYFRLFLLIHELFSRYINNVVIAGGFALSYYLLLYRFEVKFSDIDVFIHSCDEHTANLIIKDFVNNLKERESDVCEVDVAYTENVIIAKVYFNSKIPLVIQIIRRLYRSPSEVIHGFDVDCCCILLNMEGRIFATERCIYSIKHGYNVVNFDRLSPSYEFRLMKYRLRGFEIWIPHIDFVKKITVFDVNFHKYKQGLSTIINSLIRRKTCRSRENYYLDNENALRTSIDKDNKLDVSDYEWVPKLNKECVKTYIKEYVPQHFTFKTIDPGQQIIGTFNRIVLKDPIFWYFGTNLGYGFFLKMGNFIPLYKYISIHNKPLFDIDKIAEVPGEILNSRFEFIYGTNIIRSRLFRDYCPKLTMLNKSFLCKLRELDNDIIVIGDYVKRAINGVSSHGQHESNLYIYSKIIYDEHIANKAAYEIFYNYTIMRLLAFGDITPADSFKILFVPFCGDLSNENEFRMYRSIIEDNDDNSLYKLYLNYLNSFFTDDNMETKRKISINNEEICFNFFNSVEKIGQIPFFYFVKNKIILSPIVRGYRGNNVKYRFYKCGINIHFLNPNTDFEVHYKRLIDIKEIPGFFFKDGKYYARNDDLYKMNTGLNEEGTQVLQYPIWENYIISENSTNIIFH